MSETFLDSTIPHNDENVNDYSLLRVDHPNNIKLRGVCMYFKESLPLIRRTDLSNMKECLVTEINANNEKCFFTCLDRSPSQSHEELESFCSSLDSRLFYINNQHPACSIVIGDFNGKCSKWCTSDKDNTAGLELDSIITTAGYSQMINKPTHFINESSPCINVIFSSNTSFIKNCESELSIYEKCRHDIVYGTLNFAIPHPPPYYRDVWDYKHANTESTRKAISMFDWSRLSSIKMQMKKAKY